MHPQSGGASPASTARMRGSLHGEAMKGTRRASGGRHERTEGPVRQWIDRPGHVSKDLAIARELRRARTDIEIIWLAGHPASKVLLDAGERVAPECGAVDRGQRHRGALHARGTAQPRSLRVPVAAVVGPEHTSVPGGGSHLRYRHRGGQRGLGGRHPPGCGCTAFAGSLCHDLRLRRMRRDGPESLGQRGGHALNALWALDGRVYRDRVGDGRRHSALFIGEPEDIPDKALGWGLPNRREHARSHYQFVGHAIGFRPEDLADRLAWRHALGYGEEPLIVCAAGGTSIGRDLLELCGASLLPLRERLPDVRMVLVCGPRLPVGSVRAPEGGGGPRLRAAPLRALRLQ